MPFFGIVSNAGDRGLIPGSGRSPGEGNGNPMHYSCLENPMDGGAWEVIVHGVAKSWTRLSDFTFFLSFLFFIMEINVEIPPKVQKELPYDPLLGIYPKE